MKRIAEAIVDDVLAKRLLVGTDPPQRILSYVSKSLALTNVTVQGRVAYGHDFFFDLVDAVDTYAFTSTAPRTKTIFTTRAFCERPPNWSIRPSLQEGRSPNIFYGRRRGLDSAWTI